VSAAVTVIEGNESYVTVTVAESLQPFPSVPTTWYVVVEPGVVVTGEPVVLLRPPAGLHAYVLPPLAVSVVDEPAQTDAEPDVTVTTGLSTVTVTVAVEGQPAADVPVMV